VSGPRTGTPAFRLGRQAPGPVGSTPIPIGRWAVLGSLSAVAVAGATAFGFWTGAGARLAKLEAALTIATVGLAIVPVAVLLLSQEPKPDARAAEHWSFAMLLRFGAGLLSTAAALVHLAVIKQHAHEYWLYGAFFVVVGLGQLAWALLVVAAPSRRLYALGALGNAAIAAFFVVTRTVGALVGPEASQPATVGFGDIATTVFEAAITALSVLLLYRVRPRGEARPITYPAVACLVILLLTAQTALALQSTVSSAPFVPQAG
jgi:hypothetical protein